MELKGVGSGPFVPRMCPRVVVVLPGPRSSSQSRGINPACALPGAEMKECLSTLCLRPFLLINSRIFLMPFFIKDFLRPAVITTSSLWLSQFLAASFLLLDLFGQTNPGLSIPVAPSSAVCEAVPW